MQVARNSSTMQYYSIPRTYSKHIILLHPSTTKFIDATNLHKFSLPCLCVLIHLLCSCPFCLRTLGFRQVIRHSGSPSHHGGSDMPSPHGLDFGQRIGRGFGQKDIQQSIAVFWLLACSECSLGTTAL